MLPWQPLHVIRLYKHHIKVQLIIINYGLYAHRPWVISSIQQDNLDNIPGKGDVLIFPKWRQLSKVLCL